MDWQNAIAKKLHGTNHAIAMTAICNTCLEPRVVQFSSPASHYQVIESMRSLYIIKLGCVKFG